MEWARSTRWGLRVAQVARSMQKKTTAVVLPLHKFFKIWPTIRVRVRGADPSQSSNFVTSDNPNLEHPLTLSNNNHSF